MNCPVCKYDNKPGATHCGMCYEVFNRSAAQNYQHAVQRDRREAEGPPVEPDVVVLSQKTVEEKKSFLSEVDWRGMGEQGVTVLKRSKKVFLIIGGVVACGILARFLFDAGLWYHLFGKKLHYAFSDETPAPYMIGMKQETKIWSERGGRLDTPMGESKSDEIGSVLVMKKKAAVKNQQTVFVTTKEWIQILNDSLGSSSRMLPKNHPSLAGARLVLDGKGVLLERHAIPSPRVAKSLPFLTPKFPKGSLRRGRTWDEPIEWTDAYGDWKIEWTGTLHWTLGELEDCRDGTCVKLTYTADVTPRLRGSPSWAEGAVRRAEAAVTTEGAVLFDTAHDRLIFNTFTYEGLLHIPISDLVRIPWELRIGRRVKDKPGDIVIHFENKIDIRKN